METQRHRTIVELLQQQPFLSVHELVRTIGVSPATVRRDIDKLVEAGMGQKVHGGIAAMPVPTSDRPSLPFFENRDLAVNAKKAIARKASGLVRDGNAIIIHGGSTCFHFGVEIALRNLSIFTQSMPLAAYLFEHSNCQLLVGGGALYREPGILFSAAQPDDQFYADQFFVGAQGVNAFGLLETNPMLVRLTREMIKLATEVIVLVDSRKFIDSPSTLAVPFDRISKLITDDGLSDKDARMLENEGVDYLVAEQNGGCAA
ncbi:transcriptional regulator, DeoR family [Cohaesibacter sp. ES.047]|uniref:DeoR/GlpR family DNA-binding transcription regulator n=1 Tax=Cohaesibacter sp. ES.047 TaxID=1798205 RepID=UPI000BB9A495|nr:DeoR/GlpR family DNA-binding transcription regulator [Cohaesibacter sp. ES.047]SNY93175.1 transcriptional regulator, DeoR family [Cohaesibacter sp. ES.047]